MMTREEIAAIDRECEQRHISRREYLDSHGIVPGQAAAGKLFAQQMTRMARMDAVLAATLPPER